VAKWPLLVCAPLAGCTILIGADELRVAEPPDEAGIVEASSDRDDRDAPGAPSDAGTDDADAPLTEPNLVAAWLFDELSGTIAKDVTGHGHDGQLQGAAAFGGLGLRGGALVLAGGFDTVVMPSLDGAAFPRSGTFSIHFRYSFTDSTNRGVFDTFTTSRNHLFLRRANNAPIDQFQVAGQYSMDGGGYAFVDTFTVTIDTWTHVVFTWSEASQLGAVYVDGVQTQTQPYLRTPYVPDQQAFRIGVNYTGLVDEVRLYDRAFSAAEAIAIP
jgi:hypothetical protein